MKKTKKQKLEEIFYQNASPEERLAYDLKKAQRKVSQLENLPADEMEKIVEKEVIKEVENSVTGEMVVKLINELELTKPKQIDFVHIKNFPWDDVRRMGGSSDGGFMGYGAYDLNLKAITLGQITADQNDYATGLGSWFRISSDAARSITGFEGGTDGRGFILTNTGSFNITLANQNAGSAAAYRILTGTGADIVLAPDDDAWVIYDSTTERWRVLMAGDVTGDVLGPASSTDNAIVRFDGTTGKLIQDYTSNAPTISDTGVVTLQGGLLFTDNTYDIGASGAMRPRTGYFGTSLISPTILGGSSTTQDLTLQTTSGIGASGADMHFLVGNNGATEAMTILNSGNVGIGTASPGVLLDVQNTSGTSTIRALSPNGAGDISINVSNAAKNITGSAGWDLRVGGVTSVSFSNGGNVTFPVGSAVQSASLNYNAATFFNSAASMNGPTTEWRNNTGVVFASLGHISSSSNRPKFNLYLTQEGSTLFSSATPTVLTSVTNYERLAQWADSTNNVFRIEAENGGTGVLRNLVLQGGGGNVGIGTTAPTNLLSLGGNSARIFWMERHTTANTAGNSLTITAGGATAAATDKNGGDLLLQGGLSTGTGESGVQIYGCVAGATGTADRTQTLGIQLLGNKLGFFGVTPVTRQTELTDELTSITHTAPVTPDYAIQDFTQTSPFGFVTADEANTVLSVILNLQTRVNELETKLTAYGLLIDAD